MCSPDSVNNGMSATSETNLLRCHATISPSHTSAYFCLYVIKIETFPYHTSVNFYGFVILNTPINNSLSCSDLD